MDKEYYNKETTNQMLENIHDKLDALKETSDRTLAQALKTNGRVNKLERYLLVVGVATGTLLFTNGSELYKFMLTLF